jgi:phage major head subunit gpT-like protein
MSVALNSSLARFYQEVRHDLTTAFENVGRLWDLFGMEVPSSSRSTMQAWLSDQPSVREWLGARQANSLGTRQWSILNKNWEASIELNRYDLDDDLDGTIAQAQMKAVALGEEFAYHEDQLMATTLEAGTTATCFDGQAFFSASHPINVDDSSVGTFSNYLGAGNALAASTFGLAKTRMNKFKRENGMPMPGPKQYGLIVPPELEVTARQILQAEYLVPGTAFGAIGAGGASKNIFFGAAVLQVNPYLTSATKWYLTAAGGRMKPLIFQRRQAPRLTRKDQDTDDNVVERNVYIYAADARYNASYGLPQLMVAADA